MRAPPARASVPPHAQQVDDEEVEIIEERPRRSGGLLAWLFLLLVMAGFIAFLILIYMPIREQNANFEAQISEHIANDETQNADLEAAQQRSAALETELKNLQTKMAALEAEREMAVAEREAALAALERAQAELSESLGEEIAAGDVMIKRRGNELVVDVADKLLFPSGHADLNERGKTVLQRVAKTVKGLPDRVFQVGGHTDSVPPSEKLQELYATNWELSTARATNVVRYLEEECAVPGKQLVAAGFAWHRPIASNRRTRGKRKNRRIEIVMLPAPKKGS